MEEFVPILRKITAHTLPIRLVPLLEDFMSSAKRKTAVCVCGVLRKQKKKKFVNFYLQVWPQGALVKHVKGLFRAEGINNAAEPGNTMHSRFFVSLFKLSPSLPPSLSRFV